MPISAEVQVFGVKESLKILGNISKEQKFEAIQKIKNAAAPLRDVARTKYPDAAPLSGMTNKGRLQYAPAKVQSGVVVTVGGRARFGEAPLVTIVQKNPGGAIFDLAGLRTSPTQNQFIRSLTETNGDAQRGMWRAIKEIRDIGYHAILKALDEVAGRANRRLVH